MSSRLRAVLLVLSLAAVAGGLLWYRIFTSLDSGPYAVSVTRDAAIVLQARGGKLYERRVSGLAPGAEAAVESPAGGEPAALARFRTARAPGEGFTFVVFGDSGVTRDAEELPDPTATQRALCAGMVASRPDFAIHVGDIAYYHSERRNYGPHFFAPFGPLLATCALFPTPGNHDVRKLADSPYYELFPRLEGENRYYSFDWGDVHFISLDGSDDVVVPPEQTAWLEADLAKVPEGRSIVAFQHFPIYSSGSKGCFDATIGPRILPALRKHGAGLFLAGHDHIYERTRPIDGITYVVTGGGGGVLYDLQPAEPPWSAARARRYHFVRFQVAPGGASAALEAVGLDGEVFDRATVPLRGGSKPRGSRRRRAAASRRPRRA